MNKPRSRANVLKALTKVSVADHDTLRKAALGTKNFWDEPGIHKPILVSFKSEVKKHYFYQQMRRCCYCSSVLPGSQAAWDAEHILDKSGHPEFMMEFDNLAAACKPCNTAKGKRSALVAPMPKPISIPSISSDYSIVHPHIDEWDEHLAFDQYGCVRAKPGRPKGVFTIKICRIESINAATLSDYFSIDGNEYAHNALFKFFTLKQKATRKKYLDLLDQLANQYNLSDAKAIVERLRSEVAVD